MLVAHEIGLCLVLDLIWNLGLRLVKCGRLCFNKLFSVLPQAEVQRVQTSAQGPDHLSAVRADGLPEGGLLQIQLGGEHARGGEAQHRLRGRHCPLPCRELRHHCGHQGQESLHLGLNLPGCIWRGGQRAKVCLTKFKNNTI